MALLSCIALSEQQAANLIMGFSLARMRLDLPPQPSSARLYQRREQAAAELKAEMARIRARAFRRAASAEASASQG